MSNSKLLDRAKELGLEPMADEPDEDLLARINAAQNGQEFDPTTALETKADEPLAAGTCPDCKGEGLRSDGRLCSTCEGTGKA